jgi:hypothetical protein
MSRFDLCGYPFTSRPRLSAVPTAGHQSDKAALWIAAGANPKEVAARAGHTSVSFTLDRYGHLYPESDAALRDRLDAFYSAGQRDQDAAVVDLFQERSRPQRHPRTRGTPPALGR